MEEIATVLHALPTRTVFGVKVAAQLQLWRAPLSNGARPFRNPQQSNLRVLHFLNANHVPKLRAVFGIVAAVRSPVELAASMILRTALIMLGTVLHPILLTPTATCLKQIL